MKKVTVLLQEGEYKANFSRKGFALFNQSGKDAQFQFDGGAWITLTHGNSYHIGVHTGRFGVKGELHAVTNVAEVLDKPVEASQVAPAELSVESDTNTPSEPKDFTEAIREANATDGAKKLMLEHNINPELVKDTSEDGRIQLNEVKAYLNDK